MKWLPGRRHRMSCRPCSRLRPDHEIGRRFRRLLLALGFARLHDRSRRSHLSVDQCPEFIGGQEEDIVWLHQHAATDELSSKREHKPSYGRREIHEVVAVRFAQGQKATYT